MKDKLPYKVGKYGSKEIWKDEHNSEECSTEVFQYLKTNVNIDGYKFIILYDGVSELLYYERDGVQIPDTFKQHKIKPDIPTIILSEIKNPKNFYVVLAGDDKYQETGGNAIERSNKNHRGVFEEKMCYNSEINPYVIFCAGSAFFKDDGTYNDYFMSKFRQMFPYTKNGKPYFWNANDEHSSYKQNWNQLYIQKNRFTKEQKLDILMNVAMESVKYYKQLLKK